MTHASLEMAEHIARHRLDEGLSASEAHQRAAQELHLQATPALWPDAVQIAACMRSRIALFHPTQNEDLRILRQLALHWMHRLADFEPHVFGPVWDGTATRPCPVQIMLCCDDSTAVDIVLMAHQQPYKVRQHVLSWHERHSAWRHPITMEVHVLDRTTQRRQPRLDPQGQPMRGNTKALTALLSGVTR